MISLKPQKHSFTRYNISQEYKNTNILDCHQDDILAALPAARYQLQRPEQRLEESHAATLPTYKPVDASMVARETKGLEALSNDAPPLAFIRNSVGNKIAPNLAPWASTVAHVVLGDHEIDANGNNKTAAAFMQFGMATDAPEIGDIVVSGENGTPAHVGFYQGVDESGNILVYGNRQAQGQPISLVAPEQLLATRKAGRVDIQTAALGHYDPKALIAINDHLANIDDEEMREATHDRLFDTFKQQKTAIETSRRDGMAELVNTLRSDLTYNLDTLPDEQKQLIGADMFSAIKARQDAMLQGTFRNDAATLAMLAQQRRHDPQAYINADPNLVYASLTDASFDAYTQDQKRMAEQLATPENFEQQLAQAEIQAPLLQQINNPSKFPDFVKSSKNPYFRGVPPQDNNQQKIEGYLAAMGVGILPQEPQKAFDEDFPNGYDFDPKTGKMKVDVDGQPIHPDAVIVGRALANQADQILSNQDTDKLIKNLTGKAPILKKNSNHNGRILGAFSWGKTPDEQGLFLNANEDPLLLEYVKRHELGHILDFFGETNTQTLSDIPKDVMDELKDIYNVKKNRSYNYERIVNKSPNPASRPFGSGYMPQDDGYPNYIDPVTGKGSNTKDQIHTEDNIRGELIAEAFSAYVTNPNAMKKRYPAAAKYLRNMINSNPKINKYIHLSSLEKDTKTSHS